MNSRAEIENARTLIADAIAALASAEDGLSGCRAQDYVALSAGYLQQTYQKLTLAKR